MVHKKPSADLRAEHTKALEAGVIVALSLVIAAFKFFPDVTPAPPIETPHGNPPIEVIQPTDHPRTAPPPPKLHPVIIESPGDIPPEDIPNTDPKSNTRVPPPLPPDEHPDFIEIFEIPEIVGGPSALAANLVYPEMARRIGREGTVVLQAYLDKTGRVVRADVLRGIGVGCDEAAVAALLKTRFHPATQRGIPVKVKVKVPIRFRLSR